MSYTETAKIIQLIPADGWRAVYASIEGEDGEPRAYSSPLLAWALAEDGSIYPVTVDRNGMVEVEYENSTVNLIGIAPPCGQDWRPEPDYTGGAREFLESEGRLPSPPMVTRNS